MSDYYDHIEQYLDGQLSEEEQQAFEVRMQAEPELASEVALLKEARQRIRFQLEEEQAVSDFKNNLRRAMAEEEAPRRSPLFVRRSWLPIALAAASIALILIFWPDGQDSLYRQYAQYPQLELTERNTAQENLANRAATQFNQGEFASSLDLLNQYSEEYPNDPELLLFKGICLIETGQVQEAISKFEQIHYSDAINKWEGTWYLALAYLYRIENENNGTISQVKELLNQIPKSSNYYEQAQRLKADIKGH